MKKSRLLALTLCFVMLISLFPQGFVFADTESIDKGKREVYLHAFDTPPSLDTSEIRTTIEEGDTANIYLAIDNPNKGDSHSKPQYDLQGYTVKIYFDTKYFEFADKENPIDFSVPGGEFDTTVDSDDVKEEDGDSVQQTMPGYMTYKPSYSEKDGYAAATIFLMGEESFFPDKTTENEDLWYNLCKLSLKPKQTGSTAVYIDYNNNSEYDLELFAKNVADEKLNFEKEVKNDGIFYITITEQGRPTMPLATKPSGTYNDKIDVQLYHTNKMPCEIYYTTDGTTDPRDHSGENPAVKKYNEGEILSIDTKTTVKAATYGNGKWSYVATFTYNFLPHEPYLFNSGKNEIPNIYSETWKSGNLGYYVYTADSKNFENGIGAGNSIYYTFNEQLSVEYLENDASEYIGSEPETQWVKVDVHSQELAMIDQSRTVRLVTKNHWGISDVSVYHLGIKPANVTATPGSGLDVEQPIKLECDTTGAKIYYTTNGDDPRKGTSYEYTAPIYLDEDSVIKAVSYYDGKWSDVSSFWYIFSDKNKSGVSAVYPSGIYTGSVEVILYPDEPGEKIEVSFDGGKTWEDYDGTIVGDTTTVDSHIEFNARIKNPENTPEDLGDKFVYIIKPLAPVFSPESCDFTNADVVTVFSPESTNENKDRFELWYTLDGTEPNGNLKAPENDVITIPITGYTKIKAVVVKDGEYVSEVVEHTYNVVYDKPEKPTVTLPSGYYTREIGSDEVKTMFITPPKGVEIYYTIGKIDTPFEGPDLSIEGGATKYIPGTEITVTNDTMIKAIAVQVVNGNTIKSEVAEFWYEITPQAPIAPESTAVKELPLIPVDALAVETESGERGFIEYTIRSGENTVTGKFCTDETDSDGHIRFYIDTKTGNAYADVDGNKLLYETGNTEAFTDSVVLEIKTVLDGAESQVNAYAYIIGDENTPLAPPYADKESGTYTESKEPFVVHFYSIYENRSDISVEWKYDGDTTWTRYNPEMPPTFETTDRIIYARVVDENGNASKSVGYIYTFNPPAPNITPASGIYLKSAEEKSYITQSNDIAIENIGNYSIYYRVAEDDAWANVRGNHKIEYPIEKTMTVMAYTYNRKTGRVSDTVWQSYIVIDENASGAVTIKWPFSQNRISAHKLGKGDYANGIQFLPESNVYYEYTYILTQEAGGGIYQSDAIMYEANAAFVPTERIDSMTITAWINGDKNNTVYTHEIDFVHLDIPVTDLPDKAEYDTDTVYHLVNAYENDPTVIVYYTTNNSDPTVESSDRKSFHSSRLGQEEKLKQTTTVKAVYFSACGEDSCSECQSRNYKKCPDGVYGEIGEYKYPVPTKTTITVGGGGGGGGGGTVTIDKTRKYTKDIFGNEHPTHIGYINGYPDGSVRPEGDITREEITAILYRITGHEYEKPFVAKGDAFPDVEANRWSAHDIEYMADKEVIYGYPDGEFKPSKNLTRAEFAALIFRFTGIKKSNVTNPFVDLDDTHWAYAEILALTNSGLVEGYEDKTFRPENNITRAEVMTVINKLLGRKPLESYVKSLKFNPYNDLYEAKWYYVTVLEATITHNYWLDADGYEYKWEDWK